MAKIIRSKCPACGDVDLPIDRVAITANREMYVFQCPKCLMGTYKKADTRILTLLDRVGVVTLGVLAELDERPPDDRPPAPLFTLDDCIDFHLNLDKELAELMGDVPQ